MNCEPNPAAESTDYVVTADHGPIGIIDRLVPEWRALCAEGPCDEPFYYPGWVVAYFNAFAPEACVTVITVRRNGALRAVLPLVARSIGFGPLRLRWQRTAANSHFPRFDVIHGVHDQQEVARALWSFMARRKQWDILHFESAPEGSMVWTLLDLAKTSGHVTRFHRPDASPWIDATQYPAQIDELIALLPAKLRKRNRRSLNRLRSRGEVEFRIVGYRDPAEAIGDAARVFYDLEAGGWKGRANSAITSDLQVRRFYDWLIADAASGPLAISQLQCNGHVVASKLNLVWNDTMYELKSGYDEAFSECSPGHLIKAYTLAGAASIGVEILDNGGRADPHKLAWTGHSRPFATCFIGNTTLLGRFAWWSLFKLGPVVQKHLGNTSILSPIKRIIP